MTANGADSTVKGRRLKFMWWYHYFIVQCCMWKSVKRETNWSKTACQTAIDESQWETNWRKQWLIFWVGCLSRIITCSRILTSPPPCSSLFHDIKKQFKKKSEVTPEQKRNLRTTSFVPFTIRPRHLWLGVYAHSFPSWEGNKKICSTINQHSLRDIVH